MMPSAAVFVSNLSLNSTGTCVLKSSNGNNVDELQHKRKDGMTAVLLVTSLATLISSAFPTGYGVGVLNAPQQIIQAYCNETVSEKYGVALTKTQLSLLWSVVVSVFLIGGMIGSLSAGSICNRFGRKRAIIMSNFLTLVGAIMFASCRATASIEILIVARFLVGLVGGFSTSAMPLYLTEMAPTGVRGLVGVFLPIGMCLGLLISQVLGLEVFLGTETRWPFLLSLYALPLTLGTLVLFFCPESPKYLYIKGRTEQALQELCRLRMKSLSELDDDVAEMKKEAKENLKMPSWSYYKLFTCRAVRAPLYMICALHAANQLSGINAVFYYSTGIFNSAGLSQLESQYASIGAGMANLTISLTSAVLVSRFGRRPLFLISIVLTMCCLAGLTLTFIFMNDAPFVPYLAIALLVIYVLLFGIGLGPIPFFIGSELFQPGPRPHGVSIGCTVNGLGNFIVGATFPTVQSVMGNYSFTLFIGFLMILGVYIFAHMPETKDRTADEVMADFAGRDAAHHRANTINGLVDVDQEGAADAIMYSKQLQQVA